MKSKTMAKRLLLIQALLGCVALSCVPSYESREDNASSVDTCSILIDRLWSENLPTLHAVEAWESDYGPGLKLTTAHYEIFTTFLEPLMLRRIPGFMESAYRAYNDQLPRPIEASGKSTVYLFANRRQWEDFTKTFAGDKAELFCKIRAGAYYLNGACVTYNIGTKRTLSALGHEGWHQFNTRHFAYRLPSWLDEGVAMLFETSTYKDGIYHFRPSDNSYRLDALRKTLATNQQMPLQELIAINPGEVLATDQAEPVKAFYSQSYALVRFLRETDLGKYAASYQRMLWDGLRGNWPLSQTDKTIAQDRNVPRTVRWNRAVGPELFKHYISGDIDYIEKEYLAFCRQIVRQ